MNAIQFIKEHGVDKAREVVEGAPEASTAFNSVSGSTIYYQLCDNWWWYNPLKKEWEMDYSKSMRINLSDLKRVVESVELIGNIKSGVSYKFHPKTQDEYEQFKELLYSISCMCQHDSYENIQTITIRSFYFNCYATTDLSIGDCTEISLNQLKQAIADYEAIYSNDVTHELSFGISLMPSERLACIDLTPRPVIDCETLDFPEDYTSPNCKKIDLEQVK
ncbi:hypothetical protein EXE30_06765 [Acinetobacter halotolerans]|uniref:Uncharacterized protein n=1 Tax=Acinetobacter halotolerans TaxID=1752076 RepID=A0A4Q6XKG2_9GAMM|nr:hypothetical protein [Acinetobacter halotolerans]RZF53671.1 hypothetical protein EXE30_06765 [Acinetobacter halotolerans]